VWVGITDRNDNETVDDYMIVGQQSTVCESCESCDVDFGVNISSYKFYLRSRNYATDFVQKSRKIFVK
jgi:hypothetical protein